jgi:hypothetical protein
LHPAIQEDRRVIAQALVDRVRGKGLDAPSVAWKSKPTIISLETGAPQIPKNAKEVPGKAAVAKKYATKESLPEHAAMLVMVRSSLKNDKPAVYEEFGKDDDGKNVRFVHNETTPQIDLWILDHGLWFIIPAEMINFDALFSNITNPAEVVRRKGGNTPQKDKDAP